MRSTVATKFGWSSASQAPTRLPQNHFLGSGLVRNSHTGILKTLEWAAEWRAKRRHPQLPYYPEPATADKILVL